MNAVGIDVSKGKSMAIINLRDYYPFYTSDCFMEVSEEVAEMFKEFDRKEAAYSFAQNNDLVRIFRSIFFALVDKLRTKS